MRLKLKSKIKKLLEFDKKEVDLAIVEEHYYPKRAKYAKICYWSSYIFLILAIIIPMFVAYAEYLLPKYNISLYFILFLFFFFIFSCVVLLKVNIWLKNQVLETRLVILEEESDLDVIKLLDELAKQIYEINIANGWNVVVEEDWEGETKIPAKLMLVVSEVSEALEAYRNNDLPNFREELADTIIRLLDISIGLKLQIGEAILLKLEVNRKRGYRHGKKKV